MESKSTKTVTHYLKCWPEYYTLLLLGLKKFELRKNDRNYQKGHRLIQQEFNPSNQRYTGRQIAFTITHVFDQIPPEFGLMEGFVIMNIEFERKRMLPKGPPAEMEIEKHLAHRLERPGLFSNEEAWSLCKSTLPYAYTTVTNAIRKILTRMQEQKQADRVNRSTWLLFPEKWKKNYRVQK